jgi:hypothetical protein
MLRPQSSGPTAVLHYICVRPLPIAGSGIATRRVDKGKLDLTCAIIKASEGNVAATLTSSRDEHAISNDETFDMLRLHLKRTVVGLLTRARPWATVGERKDAWPSYPRGDLETVLGKP